MATQFQNLSTYNPEVLPPSEVLQSQYYAIVVADWNPQITHALLDASLLTLEQHGVAKSNITVMHVPGTVELTYAASRLVYYQGTPNAPKTYNAIIVLGCVIQGETPHFTYVCESVTQGITHLNTLAHACPVIFGVITTNTLQQAIDRAGGIHGNKGVEAAITAIKMANLVW